MDDGCHKVVRWLNQIPEIGDQSSDTHWDDFVHRLKFSKWVQTATTTPYKKSLTLGPDTDHNIGYFTDGSGPTETIESLRTFLHSVDIRHITPTDISSTLTQIRVDGYHADKIVRYEKLLRYSMQVLMLCI
jgi:hypothetical protein